MTRGRFCQVFATGLCAACKHDKHGCSLVSRDRQTGKPLCNQLTPDAVLKYRLKQWEELHSEVKRGKEKEGGLSDDDEQKDLEQVPSLLASIASISGLGDLTLGSGGSSAANTPGDSPSGFSPQPFSECPSQAREKKAFKVYSTPKPSAGKPASRPLQQLSLSIILQVSPLRNQSPHCSCSSLCIGGPCILKAHLLRVMMEEFPPGFLHWRRGRTT